MTARLRTLENLTGIRCVALDAVGTLIYAEPSVFEVYADIGRQFGSRCDINLVRSRLAPAMREAEQLSVSRFGEAGRTNEETERLFWEHVVGAVMSDVPDRRGCFECLFEHFARPSAWRCFADVGDVIRELNRRGIKIVIASNFDARLNRVCDGLGQLRDVTQRLISSLAGFRKTHPGFYRELLQLSGHTPDELLMVGDDWTNDVESARRAGLSAVWLNRNGNPSSAEHINSLSELLELLP